MSEETQISNLIFEYARRIDAGDFEGVAALFKHGRISTLQGDVEGEAAILAMYRSSTRLYPNGTPKTRHLTTNLAIELDGDRARCRSYYTVMQATEDFPLQAIISGHYEDELSRLEGQWVFTRRHIGIDLLGDLSRHLLIGI